MPLIAYITLWKACPLSTFLKLEPSAVLVQESFPSCLPSIKDVLSLQADGDDSLIFSEIRGNLEMSALSSLNSQSFLFRNGGYMKYS